MIQLRSRQKNNSGNSVSYFSGANFSNQIKSEYYDWSMQRKARNLNFRVELRQLKTQTNNFLFRLLLCYVEKYNISKI